MLTTSSPTPFFPVTILVVDDEPAIRESLASLFGDEGFAVRTAQDGLEALILQNQQPADLIISDVHMPLVGGDDLVAELRERGDRTPVVLMSAAHVPACDLPGVRAMAKPFDLDVVLNLVTGMLVMEAATVMPDASRTGEPAPANVPASVSNRVVDLVAGSALRLAILRACSESTSRQLARTVSAAESARRLLREQHGEAAARALAPPYLRFVFGL
jgi:DNA-binding response OmpR family regulator